MWLVIDHFLGWIPEWMWITAGVLALLSIFWRAWRNAKSRQL